MKSIRINSKHMFWLKIVLHFSALFLLTVTYYQAFNDQLGADPVKAILHFTGIGAFNLLLLSLAVSPLAMYFRQGQLLTIRRPVGLYAYVYAISHFSSYLIFELQLEWSLIVSEVLKRPYISLGFIALLILSLLAVTSTKSIQRRLGRTWQKMHNWVYLASVLVAIHYIWSVKSEIIQPIIYAVILFSLLFIRRDKFIKTLKSRINKRTKTTQNKKKLA